MTLVTSAACILCEQARAVLDRVAADHSLRIRAVDLASEEGSALARRHRVPFPPIVLLDGDLHAYGRLSERRLRRDLARRLGNR